MTSGPLVAPARKWPAPKVFAHDRAFVESGACWTARHALDVNRRRAADGAAPNTHLVVERGSGAASCQSCHTLREQERSRRASKVRRHPDLPPQTPGCCVLCGDPVRPPRRRWCSQGCVDVWMTVTNPALARAHLVGLMGRVCWECFDRDEKLRVEVDHRRPLWSLTDEERLQVRWWLPGNLQLLCVPCHRRKTTREHHERTRLRRGDGPP